MSQEINSEKLKKFNDEFVSNPSNLLAMNFVSKSDPLESCLDRPTLELSNHIFSHKVDEIKPVTNQRSSGRCWLFACLNAIRIPFAKQMNLDDFEFSQGYLFVWDKMERCNYFLRTVVSIAKRSPPEKPEGRLMSFLLSSPISDGGQWDMAVNIIKKYGVMPKKCFPESYSCESSRRMNGFLKSKLREYCFELRGLIEQEASEEEIDAKIDEQMSTIYRIICVCLSIPPTEFTWEYYDKSKKYHKIGPISPLDFYENHVKPKFDVDSKICLVSDPRAANPTGRTYTVDCLGNVVGGQPIVYNNQEIDLIINLAAKSIKSGEPVWFGCDVSKFLASKQGYLNLDIHNVELVFGTKIHKLLDKANRLIYGDSQMNHAMLLTGVHIDEKTKQPLKWRIENSWGDDKHDKGFLTMTSAWFKEFVFEIVVDKSICPEEVLKVMETEPIVLPAWDPMGALA